MKPKLTQTIPLRFPGTGAVLHMSVFREEMLVRVLSLSAVVLVFSYITIVGMTIVNVIAQEEALDRITATRSSIAQLEHEYYTRMESLSIAQAAERGLMPVSDKQFVQRLSAVGVANDGTARNGI